MKHRKIKLRDTLHMLYERLRRFVRDQADGLVPGLGNDLQKCTIDRIQGEQNCCWDEPSDITPDVGRYVWMHVRGKCESSHPVSSQLRQLGSLEVPRL
jgi:hypothetical protein